MRGCEPVPSSQVSMTSTAHAHVHTTHTHGGAADHPLDVRRPPPHGLADPPGDAWRGCTPLGTPARPAADARAPSAASTASASRALWQRGSPSSSATACGSSAR
eukprot:1422234-Prymnesium_polylepis.1